MPILFSRSCEYAVQAVLLLAVNREREPVLLRDITDRLGIPHPFLSKILQMLGKDGIVVSHKGISGGYSLGRPAEEITLNQIARSVDGKTILDGCVLGFSGYNDAEPCPVCHRWTEARGIILDVLNHKSVAELSKGIGAKLALEGTSGR